MAGKVKWLREKSGARPTLADVADLAGVSTASVSRVLNKGEFVSETLRLRVESAVRTLGWIPNAAAKALASRRTRTVGALIPNLGHPNFGRVIQALQHKLDEHSYTLFLACTEQKLASTRDQALKMVEQGVECLVMIGLTQPPDLFPFLKDQGIPSVITYTSGVGTKTDFSATRIIGFDNRLSMSKVVRHLLDFGHRSFGCITITAVEHNDRMMQRVDGAREALAVEGLAIRPQHLIEVPSSSIACGREGLRRILEATPWPTAVICTNDYFAAGALFEADSQGIHVPQQISIVGFDDLELSAHLHPPLTTVTVPDEEMGNEIGKFIVAYLEGEEVEELALLFPAELVVRASAGPPPDPRRPSMAATNASEKKDPVDGVERLA